MERHEENEKRIGKKKLLEGDEALMKPARGSKEWIEEQSKGTVDVLLSDMSDPWEQVNGHWMNSLTKPHRMMNTSGIRVKDHVGSMVRFLHYFWPLTSF